MVPFLRRRRTSAPAVEPVVATVHSPVSSTPVTPEWVRRMREQHATTGTRFATKDLTGNRESVL